MKTSTVLKGMAIGLAAGAAIGGAAHAMNTTGYQIKKTAMKAKNAAQDAAEMFIDEMK